MSVPLHFFFAQCSSSALFQPFQINWIKLCWQNEIENIGLFMSILHFNNDYYWQWLCRLTPCLTFSFSLSPQLPIGCCAYLNIEPSSPSESFCYIFMNERVFGHIKRTTICNRCLCTHIYTPKKQFSDAHNFPLILVFRSASRLPLQEKSIWIWYTWSTLLPQLSLRTVRLMDKFTIIILFFAFCSTTVFAMS